MKTFYKILAVAGCVLLLALPIFYLRSDRLDSPAGFWLPYLAIAAAVIILIKQLQRME